MNTIQYSINDLMSTMKSDDVIEQYDLNDDTKKLYFDYLESLEDDNKDPYYCWCGYCYDCNFEVVSGTALIAKVNDLGETEWFDCVCNPCADIYKRVLMEKKIRFSDFKKNTNLIVTETI